MKEGGRILALIIAIGILAAMVAATLMIATTNSLGSNSREAAASATDSTVIGVDGAVVRMDGGQATELTLLIRHVGGSEVELAALNVTIDTGLGVWVARGEWQPARDEDGSIEQNRMNLGDLMQLRVDLDVFPMNSAHGVQFHVGSAPAGQAILHWPAATNGIVSADLG